MRFLASLMVLLVAASGWAAPAPFRVASVPVRESQQFKVIDARPVTAMSPGPLKSETGVELLRLDADVLLFSAERIRECLRGQLGLPREGGGKIQLVLYIAAKPNDLIRLASVLTPGGWEYEVDIPDQVDREKLIRGVVGVLLLEMSNRGQGPKSAEIPLWLVEGLLLHLSAVAGPELVVSAVPLGSMFQVVRIWRGSDHRLDYLQTARAVLKSSPPLSFSELAHPRPETLAGDRLKVFQYSSQLFVYELLQSKNGAASLLAMLRDLPNCWNWETAFLRGFSGQFNRPLDVEKWWSVNVLAFVSRDPNRVWSKVNCLDKLDELLLVPAQIRVSADTMPQRKNLTLQQVIANWDFASQAPVLQQKLLLLTGLRFNAPTDVLPIIDGYERTLAAYLQRRNLAKRTPETRMQPTFNSNLVSKDALEELELLDKRRQALRPEQTLSVNSPISP